MCGERVCWREFFATVPRAALETLFVPSMHVCIELRRHREVGRFGLCQSFWQSANRHKGQRLRVSRSQSQLAVRSKRGCPSHFSVKSSKGRKKRGFRSAGECEYAWLSVVYIVTPKRQLARRAWRQRPRKTHFSDCW